MWIYGRPRRQAYLFDRRLLSTLADRQGVHISFTVYLCFCVCTVTDFSAEDKASGITFALLFVGVQGRESPIFVNFATPEAKNRTNWPAREPRPPAC